MAMFHIDMKGIIFFLNLNLLVQKKFLSKFCICICRHCISDNTLHLSGIDLLDGTPILDVKPYIMEYDTPQALLKDHDPPLSNDNSLNQNDNTSSQENTFRTNINIKNKIPPESCIENCLCEEEIDNGSAICTHVKTPDWIVQPQSPKLEVIFTPKAHEQLQMFSQDAEDPDFSLKFLKNSLEASETISAILREDPRHVRTRNRTDGNFYQFTVDNMCVTCLFSNGLAIVTQVSNKKDFLIRGNHTVSKS